MKIDGQILTFAESDNIVYIICHFLQKSIYSENGGLNSKAITIQQLNYMCIGGNISMTCGLIVR